MPLDDPQLRHALDDDPQLPRMSFGDHLDELRSRLLKSLLAIVVAIVAVLPFKHQVQEIVIDPYRTQWRMGFLEHVARLEGAEAAATAANQPMDKLEVKFLAFCREHREPILAGTFKHTGIIPYESGYPMPYSLYATGGLEDTLSFMWASLVFALVLAGPVVIWQAWAFLAAGLYPKERAVFYRYFPFMVGLMGVGVSFGYFVVLPYMLRFLANLMDPTQVTAIFTIGQFLNLLFALTAAMGLVFQLPLVMVALQRIGLVTHRGFVKNWRMTILVICIVAAVVTPPEPVSMLLMAGPMVVLFGLGLVLTWFARHRDAPIAEAA
ncbi:MAG: twin-arginine translocase subunit TatC [Planctomycetota bacterium]|jgi:Tat protein translocase TatC